MCAFPFYEPGPSTPTFADDELGLKAVFPGGAIRAEFPAHGDWIVFGSYRLGPDLLAQVDARPKAFVRLVVTHKQSGAVYVGGAGSSGEDDGEGVGIDAEDGELIALKEYFCVDVKQECGIPPEPGTYWLVVLLGPLATPVLELEVT